MYSYDEQHYLAVSVPVPFTMETDATERKPLLAIYMHLDFQVAADLMLQIDQRRSDGRPGPFNESGSRDARAVR